MSAKKRGRYFANPKAQVTIFIVMALLWGWGFQGIKPDTFDIIGASISVVGVMIIYYMPRKNEVYTWRVSSATKASLEEVARSTNRSVAQLLDEIVADHLSSASDGSESDMEQHRFHSRAARFLGCFAGGAARRSERARELVRARLKRRHASAR